MAQVMTQERATAKRRNGAAHGAVLVSGYKLARHFGITRQGVDALATQGVIERRPDDGLFDQDQCRLTYFAHLRAEHRRSPRTQADADHVKVKTEMLHLKLMERRGELVRREDSRCADRQHRRRDADRAVRHGRTVQPRSGCQTRSSNLSCFRSGANWRRSATRWQTKRRATAC